MTTESMLKFKLIVDSICIAFMGITLSFEVASLWMLAKILKELSK